MTNLQQKQTQIIYGGIFSGIEPFWYENEKWVIANGQFLRFKDADPKVQQTIAETFRNDKRNIEYLKKMGYVKFTETFERWYRCVVGGLDCTSDISSNNKFTPDAYNNMCTDYNCEHRGKLCSRAVGLKNFEVQTIIALKAGENWQRTASNLCISTPAIKSRVEKIKIKLGARNMAELMSHSAKLGI